MTSLKLCLWHHMPSEYQVIAKYGSIYCRNLLTLIAGQLGLIKRVRGLYGEVLSKVFHHIRHSFSFFKSFIRTMFSRVRKINLGHSTFTFVTFGTSPPAWTQTLSVSWPTSYTFSTLTATRTFYSMCARGTV